MTIDAEPIAGCGELKASGDAKATTGETASRADKKLVVIIPALDESATITDVIGRIPRSMPAIAACPAGLVAPPFVRMVCR